MRGIDQWVSFLNPEPSTMANTIAIENNNIIAEMIIRIMRFWNKLKTISRLKVAEMGSSLSVKCKLEPPANY